MKKILLLTILAFTATNVVNAQCTPNPLYADSIFGVWPDTITGFEPAMEGVWWTDTLDFKIPTESGDIDPNFPGNLIDSVSLTTITNLPPGIVYYCNSNTPAPCTFLGGMQGCGLLEGIPTAEGTYDIDIDIMAFVLVGSITMPVQYSFTGYSITVGPLGVVENSGNISKVEQNVPNPFSNETKIDVYLRNGANIELTVHDMVGKTLYQTIERGIPGKNELVFEANDLGQGIYLYTIESGGESVTRRMIVK